MHWLAQTLLHLKGFEKCSSLKTLYRNEFLNVFKIINQHESTPFFQNGINIMKEMSTFITFFDYLFAFLKDPGEQFPQIERKRTERGRMIPQVWITLQTCMFLQNSIQWNYCTWKTQVRIQEIEQLTLLSQRLFPSDCSCRRGRGMDYNEDRLKESDGTSKGQIFVFVKLFTWNMVLNLAYKNQSNKNPIL